MSSPIPSISTSLAPVQPPLGAAIRANPGQASGGDLFGAVMKDAVKTVEGLGAQSRQSVERFLAGEPQEIHQMVLEAQRAELAFELFLQVRNKVVQAYQEVMRMQL